MRKANFRYTRRDFLMTAAAVIGATALPAAPSRAAAKFRRYNVTSPRRANDARELRQGR